jgi:hypothetical protein
MLNTLIPMLQAEERQLVAELRETTTFRRLDAIRRVIALYGATPPAQATTPAEPSSVPEIEGAEAASGVVHEANKAVSAVRAALAAVTPG